MAIQPFTFYMRHSILLLFWLLWISAAQAELVFTPQAPIVEVDKQITLSVSGTSGEITWSPSPQGGQIQGKGNQVTYIAPSLAGFYVLTVFDSKGNVGVVKITVTLAETISLENANWEVFTNRSYIRALVLSEEGQTLWVATAGGLEQREAQTGELKKVLTNLDGLPSNSVNSFVTDENGGLWIGTAGGLYHRYAQGTGEVFNKGNSGLPNNHVSSVIKDGQGGLWVGANEAGFGLAHRHADGTWEVFNKDNSGMPSNNVSFLMTDVQGGVWVGTGKFPGHGLAHRRADGSWELFNQNNSKLPNNGIVSLLKDGHGGLWIGTWYGGLAHRHADGNWEIFNQDNSGLPDKSVTSLLDDGRGGLWVGTNEGGLAHRHADGRWDVFNQENSDIPHNQINSILADGLGGLWIGTGNFEAGSGVIHYHADGTWEVFKQTHAGLPDNDVTTILTDALGDIWVGTYNGGLAHLTANGAWELFDKNTGLPSNQVNSLISDGFGGLWIGTNEGLARRHADGRWEIFNPGNSGLPDTDIYSLFADDTGLWVGTKGGLAHQNPDGTWENLGLPSVGVYSLITDAQKGVWMAVDDGLVHLNADRTLEPFNKDNSGLPDNWVTFLLDDGLGGIWIGTKESGLARRKASGTWEVFNTSNSELPSNRVNTIIKDDQGGIWVGTDQGLAHRNPNSAWVIFNNSNAGAPANWVNTLLSDNHGGIWVGTSLEGGLGGLSHLTFGQKSALCTQVNTTEECNALLNDKRAAIIIHPRGQGRGYNQAFSIEFMATHAYRTLQARGYDNDEIYFLSYKPDVDINGDGMVDRNVVDGPITAFDLVGGTSPRDLTRADVLKSFDWAKQQGKLGHPLLLIFVDHALTGKLRLDPFNEILTAQDLGNMLTDYQQATDNQVAVVLEACHTGSLVSGLAGPNRVIISSTAEDLAYYDNLGTFSFSKFFFDNLRRGDNFFNAFQTVKDKLPTYGHPFNQQVPQLDDDGDGQANSSRDGRLARKICLNGCFGALSGEITLEAETVPSTVTVGQTVSIAVRAGITEGSIKRVWALVITPEAAKQRSEEGFSLIPTPVVKLHTADNHRVRWQGSFSGFRYKGEYVVTFMAEDDEGFITAAQPVVMTLPEGPEAPAVAAIAQTAYHDGDMFKVKLPPLPNGQVQYVGVALPDGTIFVLADLNGFTPFDGANLPVWQGSEVAIEVPISAGIPRGEYTIYLLRVPVGLEQPIAHPEQWVLGVNTFKVE